MRTEMALTLFLVSCISSACKSNPDEVPPERNWALSSPDGSLRAALRWVEAANEDIEDGETSLQYALYRDGKTLLDWSPLGLETNTADFRTQLTVNGTATASVEEVYTAIHGKSRERLHQANTLTLSATDPAGVPLAITFRAADDGVAYRYRLSAPEAVTVLSEASGFNVAASESAWMTPYDLGGALFGGAYEQVPQAVATGDSTEASGWAFPALFEAGEADWLLITEADLSGDYCGSRLHEIPDGKRYPIRFPRSGEGMGVGAAEPTSTGPFDTPWRVIIAGDLHTVVESTLVEDLSAPSRVADPSWIRPGIAAWSWFSQYTGGPDLQREYIAFAAEMGWEHVLIDEGWDRWSESDTVVPALIEEAAAEGVGIFLWYNSGGEHNLNPGTPRDQMGDPELRDEAMAKISGWGAAGIKVDFFESDKQDRIQQYLGIAADAAAHELMVNFHGATLPRGWSRTYPNIVTHEAVHGAEYYETPIEGPRPIDNVRFAFTRNVVGPMDYTPLTFAAAQEEVGTSYAHQLALAVVFESGVQHFADRGDANPELGFRKLFADYPFTREVLMDVPAAWEETLLLEGHPDSHIVLARRSGTTWYVGAINGTDSTLSIGLEPSFLAEEEYELTAIIDGNTDRELAHLSTSDSAPFNSIQPLPPNGGFLFVYQPR
jgi:alpha-glucosidase